MRTLRSVFPLTALLAASMLYACSESSSGPQPGASGDAGTDATPTDRDAADTDSGADGGADSSEPFTTSTEAEPNDGKTNSELNDMAIPGSMTGVIGSSNDADLFGVAPSPGEFWEWSLAPATADLAPHLTIFDSAGGPNPTVLAQGSAGATITLQHFVLGAAKFVAAVRDARNVGNAPAGRGGATYGYTLSARRKTPAPIALTLPSKKTGKLASLSSIDLYSFTLGTSTALDVAVHAELKSPASTLDSRVSLWNATTKKSVGTNDDISGSSDSKLGGTLPAGDYLVIVENEGTNATDLSYEVELVAR